MSLEPTVVPGMVSTVIPVHNRPAMLPDAVDCVVRQTYRPVEVIIVDDGSTDETPEVGKALVKEHPEQVQYHRQFNQGAGAARNRGFTRTRGEYVEFLDSDDLIAPTKFERQVAALRERPECGVAYCVTLRRRLTGAEVVAARTGERFDRILPEFLTCRGWHTNTPLWRRTVCEAIGAWGRFRVMEDWEYDCRAGILGVRPVYCPEPLATVRDHSGDRAGRSGTGLNAEMLRGYFAAHRSIYERLQQAALTGGDYMRPFSRRLFRIARLCGARGLKVEAREALELALEAARPYGPALELRMFRAAARLIGWQMASRLSEGARNLLGGVR